MLQQVPLAGYLTTGEISDRCGSGAPYATPNEAYETADGHLRIAAYQAGRWPRFCAVIGRPELAEDLRYAMLPDRMKHRAELTEAINQSLRRRGTSEWLEVLEAADISCAPVADYAQVAASPQLAANDTEHVRAGTVVMPGFAIGGRPPPAGCAAPLLGAHNALLREDEFPEKSR